MATPLILKDGHIKEQSANDPINIPGKMSFGHALQPPIITATVNDYNPTGKDDTILMLLTSSGNYNITGIVAPSPKSTQLLCIFNIGTNNLTLNNNDAASLADNRILLGGAKTVQTNEGIFLIYDDIYSKWRCLALNV